VIAENVNASEEVNGDVKNDADGIIDEILLGDITMALVLVGPKALSDWRDEIVIKLNS